MYEKRTSSVTLRMPASPQGEALEGEKFLITKLRSAKYDGKEHRKTAPEIFFEKYRRKTQFHVQFDAENAGVQGKLTMRDIDMQGIVWFNIIGFAV